MIIPNVTDCRYLHKYVENICNLFNNSIPVTSDECYYFITYTLKVVPPSYYLIFSLYVHFYT